MSAYFEWIHGSHKNDHVHDNFAFILKHLYIVKLNALAFLMVYDMHKTHTRRQTLETANVHSVPIQSE